MIQKRLERKNYFIPFNSPKGPTSPLTDIEDDVVALILAMSKCRQSLNVSQGLQLINDIIFKTQHQKKLITFKERHCSSSKGCVGKGYWRGFLRRNSHLLVTKRGHHFELDRSSWTTYANIRDMYDSIEEEMIDCGLAERRGVPE